MYFSIKLQPNRNDSKGHKSENELNFNTPHLEKEAPLWSL